MLDEVKTRHGAVLCMNSPVDCKRTLDGFIEAHGAFVEHDGRKRRIIGLECHAIGRDLETGDPCGLLLEEEL